MICNYVKNKFEGCRVRLYRMKEIIKEGKLFLKYSAASPL